MRQEISMIRLRAPRIYSDDAFSSCVLAEADDTKISKTSSATRKNERRTKGPKAGGRESGSRNAGKRGKRAQRRGLASPPTTTCRHSASYQLVTSWLRVSYGLRAMSYELRGTGTAHINPSRLR